MSNSGLVQARTIGQAPFADGHVHWYRVEQLKTTVDPADAATDVIPKILGLKLNKPRNDGQNPWWRL